MPPVFYAAGRIPPLREADRVKNIYALAGCNRALGFFKIYAAERTA